MFKYILFLLSVCLAGTQLYAQQNTDSLKVARQKQLEANRVEQKRRSDSTQAERLRVMDSTKAAQKKYFDSVKQVRDAALEKVKADRKRVSDSLAVIKKYKESKRYKDSVVKARQAKLDSITVVRTARLDSIKAERKRVTDSIVTVRKAYTDSIKAVQKKRSDSLAVIREYKQSKRYKDSVEVVRKLRSDSIKSVRAAYYDSVATERKRVSDSIATVRKTYSDSITTARKIYADSIGEVRKVRTDSLAKMKEKREKDKKVREKQREDKAKLSLELKIKKKREAYNNEQMLKKRWGFPRSIFQNTFTRFNYYFNADQKMDEALDNMQRFRRENYDSLLALYPFNPDRDSAVLAPDMDSIIQKASLGIQIHDPRTKWGDDLYLLLGQAYYYKGDYKNSEAAFKYVVSLRDKKKKKKSKNTKNTSIIQEDKKGVAGILMHRSVHNEAILWLSRVLTQQHKEGEAESVLDLVETDPNFSGSLSGRIALEKSFIRLNQGDLRGAIQPLGEVVSDTKMPDWIRIRAAYINGQLQQRYEDYVASAASFEKVQDLHPKVDMDFYAKKNMATSLMMAGGAQEDAVATLKSILKDGKYAQYYEQVYYLLGRLSINGGEQDQAIVYLKQGIDAPKATNGQKAQSYATLGDIYYGKRDYEDAKDAYDSASVYMGEAPEGELMTTALRRSVVLGNLTGPLRTITHNDSLLTLAEMDEKSQRAVVRKYIKMLEDKRADSIFQAENAGLTAAMKNAGNNTNQSKNNYANWYYSNPALMQKGYNDFRQKWGSRPLVDNWRRSSAGGFAQNDNNASGDNDGAVDANGIPTEEALLAAIPKSQESKDSALLAIRQSYIAGANAYVKDLEDYAPAIGLLDTLDRRFPKHEFDAEATYLRYVIAMKQGRYDDAKKYNEQLQNDFGDSKWAKLTKPTEDGEGLGDKEETVVAYYDKTYSLLLQREYATVLPMAKEGQRRYQIPVYKDRFQIIEAVAQAMLENYTSADSILTVFMTTHKDPNDSLRRWADAVLQHISQNRSVISKLPNAAAAGTVTRDTSAAGGGVVVTETVGEIKNKVPVAYTFDANEEHLVIFIFKQMEQRTKGVQVAIEDFNKFKFGSLQLETGMNMLNATDGVILVKKFTNKNQALIYMNSLKKTTQIFREYQANEYNVVMISSSNYNKLAADKDIQGYLKFFKSKY